MKLTCIYCGKSEDAKTASYIPSDWTIDARGSEKFAYHRNCKGNTLGIHVEEIIDTQDLFGRQG